MKPIVGVEAVPCIGSEDPLATKKSFELANKKFPKLLDSMSTKDSEPPIFKNLGPKDRAIISKQLQSQQQQADDMSSEQT